MPVIAMAATMSELDGMVFHPTMVDPCAKCMFSTMTCGTMQMCPTSVGGKAHFSGDKGSFDEQFLCFCLKPSPIPCFMGCGVGPCAFVQHLEKQSDTLYVGTGDSILAGGCCKGQMHNKGDQIKLVDGKLEFWAGSGSMAYPPCFWGKKIAEFSAPAPTGAPVATPEEMQR